jgi:hypothetical protein
MLFVLSLSWQSLVQNGTKKEFVFSDLLRERELVSKRPGGGHRHLPALA